MPHRRQYMPHSRPSTRLERYIESEREARTERAKASRDAVTEAAELSRSRQLKQKSAFRSFVDKVKRVLTQPVKLPKFAR